jgi:hypothetical protein
MLTESQVIDAVRTFLEAREFRVDQCLTETQHGEDIIAFAPDGLQRITIEAKGETSSKSFTKRFGCEFNTAQVRNHVARAFYSAAQHCSTVSLSAIALPKNEPHRKCVQRILPALKKLRIEVFWVLSNQEVEVEHIWKLWETTGGSK